MIKRWVKYKFNLFLNRILLSNKRFNRDRSIRNLGSIGKGSFIDENVILTGFVGNIFIGSNVKITGDVILNCDSKDSKIIIGDNCNISGPSQFLTYNGSIKFGSNCSVNPFSIIYGHGGLVIGDYVRIAAHTVIIPANHIFQDNKTPIALQGLSRKGITIEDDVWVGSGVRILDGSFIRKGSVIGCSTVVNSSFEPYSIIVGIPGKKIKSRKTQN